MSNNKIRYMIGYDHKGGSDPATEMMKRIESETIRADVKRDNLAGKPSAYDCTLLKPGGSPGHTVSVERILL
jgi:hypothetical protein